MRKFYKFDIQSIDAWKTSGQWEHNACYTLESGLFLSEERMTTRGILKALRKWEYLSNASKGKMEIRDDFPYIEILLRSTQEPVLMLAFSENEYTSKD